MNVLAALPSIPNFKFTAKTSESVLERTGSRPTATERWNTVKKVVVSEKSGIKTSKSEQEHVESPPKMNDKQIKNVNKKTSTKEHGKE